MRPATSSSPTATPTWCARSLQRHHQHRRRQRHGGLSAATAARPRRAHQRAVRRRGGCLRAISSSPTPAMRRCARSTPAGTISTFAGTGHARLSGRWRAGAQCAFDGPEGVAVDAAGNVYIADTFNGRIRRVATDGTITTFAGTGTTGVFSGDGGPASRRALAADRRRRGPRGQRVHRGFRQQQGPHGHQRHHQHRGGPHQWRPADRWRSGVNARLEGPTGVTSRRQGQLLLRRIRARAPAPAWRVSDYKVWKVSSARHPHHASPATEFPTIPRRTAPPPQLNGPPVWRSAAHSGSSTSPTRRISGCASSAGRRADHARGHGRGRVQRRDRACPDRRSSIVPNGVAADAQGNWYVADTGNNRVRKVQPGGNCSPSRATATQLFRRWRAGHASQRQSARRRGGGCAGQRLHRRHAGQRDSQSGAGRHHHHVRRHRRIRV